MKQIIYIAHPVSGDAKANALNCCDWVKWFVENDPTRVYIAPWVAEVLGVGDAIVNQAFYDRILDDDMTVVARLDGIVAVGGKWSTGMRLERAAAFALHKPVVDYTEFRTPNDLESAWKGLRCLPSAIFSDWEKAIQIVAPPWMVR